ncbi:MAG: divergent polysaccharide deacetylase family protein [Elusimicrobia bacterium]|nr:divergent polysaccharide deacetylase family protein [Elusimicrobiota bacterium]
MKGIELAAALLVAAPAAAKPRLAVVIDDFGLEYKATPADAEWFGVPWPFTAAVMPESPHSKRAALDAARAGKPVILHFPFDPFQSYKLPAEAADPEDVRKAEAFLAKSLAQVPGAAGLNNHRSEKATKNRPLMAWLMGRLKERGLYFVDSRVSGKTVAYDEARRAGLPAAINDFFLDQGPRSGEAFCRKWLKTAAALARRRGSAVVIGHHYFRSTLDCLNAVLPELEKAGIELVPVSELAGVRPAEARP